MTHLPFARRLFREPLVHFMIAGGALFAALTALSPPASGDVILVDRPALLEFIQYRSKAFEPRAAADILDGMGAMEKRRLVDDYIAEEALYREARTLGLDANDYVVRQRLVQKLQFVADGVDPPAAPEEALRAYFAAHAEDYVIPAGVTFSHRFFSGADAEARALSALQDPEPENISGDRFLFLQNYVERTENYVADHFGPDFAAAVFAAETNADKWQGPLQSRYGWHILRISARTPETAATFDDAVDRVTEDYARTARLQRRDSFVDRIIARYDIRMEIETP